MVNILKRIKNIWRLGDYEIQGTNKGFPITASNIKVTQKVKPAQIIRMDSPVKKLLQDEK